jgi:hypothetical protein
MIAVEEHKRPIRWRSTRFEPHRPGRSVRRSGSADQVQDSSLPLTIPGAGSQGMMSDRKIRCAAGKGHGAYRRTSAVVPDGNPVATARHGSQRQPAQVGFPGVFPGMSENRNDPETGKKFSTERLIDLSGLTRLQPGKATWFDGAPASGGNCHDQAVCAGCYIANRKRSREGMIPIPRGGSFSIWEARRSKR